MTRHVTFAFFTGILLLSSLGFIILPASAATTVLYVGGSGTGNYSTIQEAIAAASPAGIIHVYPGEYRETLVVDKPLELYGSGQNTTIINGTGSGNVITVMSDDVVIQDLTVEGSELVFPRAGIMVKANRTRIVNVTSTDNFYGAILWWGTHDAVFEGDTIYHNHRCGIYFSHSSGNRINWNRFMDNPFNGCGLYEGSNGNVIAGNLFARNGFCGVNIRDSTKNVISGNQFENNTIAVHVAPPPFESTLVGNSFQGNGQNVDEETSAFVPVGLAFVVVVFLGVLWFWRRL
jgi:parallel beta-helix repeat protein